MAVGPLGLEDRVAVPVELEPVERLEDLLDVLRRGALAVGVLDAQDERPLGRAAGQEPVVQCRPRAADVQGAGRRWGEPHAHEWTQDASKRKRPDPMLIGAHVSPAGGPAKAVERGVERGCRSIQIFNQNPRQWAARDYPDEQIAEFHEAMEASDVDALLIHAVYLLNPASEDPDFREKTLASLTTSLRMGAALGAVGRGAAPRVGAEDRGRAFFGARRRGDPRGPGRVGRVSPAPREHRGRGWDAGPDLRGARPAGRADRRRRADRDLPGLLPPVRVRLRHPRPREAGERARRLRRRSGDEAARLAAHQRLRDGARAPTATATPNLGDGEIGRAGCAAFLSEPRFEGLPCVLEGPGAKGKAVDADDMAWAFKLRKQGERNRRA